jgi:hypothetical protein
MQNIKSIEQFLNEGKQVGVLYHYTSFQSLIQILKTDSLKGKFINPMEEIDFVWGSRDEDFDKLSNYYKNSDYFSNYKVVSFTRDKNFHKAERDLGINTEVRLVVDGNRLSDNYKIQPYQYIAHYSRSLDGGDESEDICLIKNGDRIKNISNYLISIDFIKSNLNQVNKDILFDLQSQFKDYNFNIID